MHTSRHMYAAVCVCVCVCVCHTLSITETRSISLHLQYLFYESNLEDTVTRSVDIVNHMDTVRNIYSHRYMHVYIHGHVQCSYSISSYFHTSTKSERECILYLSMSVNCVC